MPNVTTPAAFGYTGGALRTNRIVPARMTFTGGTFVAGHESPFSAETVVPQLDRLTVYDRPPDVDEAWWNRHVALHQDFCDKIEEAFTAINARVDEVALYTRLNTVEALAQVANDNAAAAQQVADQVSLAAEQTFAEVDPIYAERYAYYKDFPS